MKIEKCDFCTGNAEHGSERIRLYLQEHAPAIRLSRWGCLGNCSNCFRRPFVLLNDEEILEAETAEELLETLLTKIEEPQ